MRRQTLPTIVLGIIVALFLSLGAHALIVNSFSPTDTTPTLNKGVTQTFNVTLDDTTNITSYKWSVNGAVLQNANNSQFLYTPSSTGPANIEVNATRAGGASVKQIWNATVIDPNSSTTGFSSPTIFTLGGQDQKASNPQSDDDEARDLYVSSKFNVINNEATQLNNLAFTVGGAGGFSPITDLNMTVTVSKTTLSGGESTEVTVRSRVPETLDAINDSTFREIAPQVAVITFTGTYGNGTSVSDTTSINIRRKNQLEITDIEVCIETDCEDVGENEKVDNVAPGDIVEIRITVENFYSERTEEDITIEDVELEFDIDEDEFNEDDTERIGDLNARDEEVHTFEVEVPEDVTSSVYDVVLTALGDDEYGAQHGDLIEFKLDVNRKAHDIQLDSVTANPTLLDQCTRRSTTFRLEARNIGENDEDETKLELKNQELNINERWGPFLLEENERESKTFDFTLPSFVRPGSYTVIAKSYFDTDKQTDEEGIVIEVRNCEDEQTTQNDDSSDKQQNDSSSTTKRTTQTTPTQTTNPRTTRVFDAPTTTGGSSSSSSKMDVGSLGPILLAVLFGLIIVAALALVVLRRR